MARKSKSKAQPEPMREPTPSESDYSSDSSDDTVEDEHGAELTPAMDAAILQTLARIRNKEGVYDGGNILASALEKAQAAAAKRGLTGKVAAKEEKPFLLKDLHRANLLAGVQEESDEEGEEEPLTNVEAERRARKDAVSAFHALADSDEEEDEEGFLVKRQKDAVEEEDEDAAYRSFLLEMGGGEEQVRRALGMADAPVTDYREDVESEAEEESGEKKKEKKEKKEKKDKKDKRSAEEKLAERRAKRAQADEDFLMDYILNRGWIAKDSKDVPTYEDIVGHEEPEDSGSESGGEDDSKAHPWGKLEEEDEFDERAEDFEHQYNFRFEEPGSGAILTHPRNIDSLVRRDDDKRKTKREERAERKAAEKAAQEEETRRLKGAKRREMEGMIESLKKELGDGVDWEGVERIMDGDFDEDEWERVVTAMLMAKADKDEGIEDDEGKPEWDNDDLGDYPDEEDDGWVEPTPWEEQEGEYDEEDDGPINMDADFIGFEDDVKPKKNKKDKKARRAEKRAEEEAAANAALTFEERAEKLKNVATQLNALQGEDTIGDLRTRFKYTKSAPVSFGLTPAEILMATDAELNEIVSVKHLAPYRRGGLGIAGRGLGGRVRNLKAKVSQRKWGDEMPVDDKKKKKRNKSDAGGANATPLGDGRKGKRMGKKERAKLKAAEGDEAEAEPEPSAGAKRKREEEPAPPADAPAAGEGKKKRRKKKKSATEA